MTVDTGCMELIPNGPGAFYWCDLPADPRSAQGTPRCAEHLTPDTMRDDTETLS